MDASVDIKEVTLSFPDEWDGLDCPPTDSVDPDPNDKYYRIVENDPVTAADFLNAVESNSFKTAKMCDRLSVSILDTEDGAHYHFIVFPWKDKSLIAEINLTPEHGKVKSTPNKKQPSHADWWPYSGVARENTFVKFIGRK